MTCATFPGVAIIPIATLYLSHTSFISAIGLTTKPAICLLIFFGSSSNSPTTPKPRS